MKYINTFVTLHLPRQQDTISAVHIFLSFICTIDEEIANCNSPYLQNLYSLTFSAGIVIYVMILLYKKNRRSAKEGYCWGNYIGVAKYSFFVPKKTNRSGEEKWRSVVDFRHLSNVIRDDKFPFDESNWNFKFLFKLKYISIKLDISQG